jgi:hypothetical protein
VSAVVKKPPQASLKPSGLAWRKTSPRKADFHAFATLLKDVMRRHPKS